jgi:hypothetical protein
MKQNFIYFWPVLLAALALTGCQRKPDEAVAATPSIELGPKYSAKNGLQVPEETRRSLGLKIVEVTEQKIPATLDLQLRVYHEGITSLLASATVTPAEAKQLKRGQAVRARANGKIFTGSVTALEERLQATAGLAEVLVELARTNAMASVGAFLSASVTMEPETTVLSIPRAALLECSDGYSVYTVSGEGFVRTPVKVGAMSGDLVEIKDGLYVGDQVVERPVMSLWMTELAAVKGGQACCVVPAKGK